MKAELAETRSLFKFKINLLNTAIRWKRTMRQYSFFKSEERKSGLQRHLKFLRPPRA